MKKSIATIAALAIWGGTTAAAPPTRIDPGRTVVDATGAIVGYLLGGMQLSNPPRGFY
jgi:hypothetical protein